MHIHEGPLEVVFLTFKSDITGFNFLQQCEQATQIIKYCGIISIQSECWSQAKPPSLFPLPSEVPVPSKLRVIRGPQLNQPSQKRAGSGRLD